MIAALAALITPAAAAASATAQAPFTIGTGVNPRIVVTPNGTGHIVWSIPARGFDSAAVGYCRIPAGASACDRNVILLFPTNRGVAKSGGDVTVQADSDSALRITSACYGCGVGDAQEGIQRWDTADGGTTFLPEPSLGGTPTNAGMGPDGITVGAGVYVTPADGDQVIARPGASDTTAVDMAAGTNFVQTPSIVQIPGQNRLVYAVSDLFGVRTATFNGPDFAAASLMDPGNWANDQQLPAAESGIRGTHLTAGPSGVWLTYEQKVPLDDHVRVRRFDPAKSTFGAPRSLESTSDTGDAAIDDVFSSQDGAGRIHVVWRSNLTSDQLRYTRSDTTGGVFAAPGTLATGEDYAHPVVGTGPDAAGWLAWQASDADSAIRVMRLEATSLGDATNSSINASGGAKTTTHTLKVSGATLSFQVPAGCVRRGAGFSVKLTWKKQKKKGNVFVKVSRTDFYVGAKRAKIDRRAPFTQTLKVPSTAQPGSSVALRARAFIKVRKGRSPKKSVKATIKVCT
jgi:hypothetical protein